ncbi:MAG: hypothetical protein GF308_10265 [Candidatus Heimdallarchaeota archaeon]|nr:hypothetical protein [Candidatus Heimdallarchaeota archaeon]
MDNHAKGVMSSLTSENYPQAVSKYLLTFDIENWKIFVENYYKLIAYEKERILEEIKENLDFHMVIDIISLANIIGKSIALSNALVQMCKEIDISPVEPQIMKKIEALLDSSLAEERRIGLLFVGYFDLQEFIPKLLKMSDFDILFEDAYFALGLMTDSSITQKLTQKFLLVGKNHLQKAAIAKILAQKGNPLATLWLFKSKGLDKENSPLEQIYIARELAWMGVRPAYFINSEDDFLREIAFEMIDGLAKIILYDVDVIKEVNLSQIINTLLSTLRRNPEIFLLRIIFQFQKVIEELYYDLDPFSVDKQLRTELLDSWKQLKNFPDEKALNFIKFYILEHLDPSSDQFRNALRLIRNFQLDEFEPLLLRLAREHQLHSTHQFELVSSLANIGSDKSSRFIHQLIKQHVNLQIRHIMDYQPSKNPSPMNMRSKNQSSMNEDDNDTEDNLHKYQDYNGLFYWHAIHSLGKINSKESITVLLNALDDFDPKIRLEAIKGLRRIGINEPAVEEKLVTLALHESFLSVRREALLALGSLNSEPAVQIFLKIIFEAIENGTLEFFKDIEYEYHNRWGLNREHEKWNPNHSYKDKKEIGATHKIASPRMVSSNTPISDEELFRWLDRLNSIKKQPIELREDFSEELDNDLPFHYERFKEDSLSQWLEDPELFEEGFDEEEDESLLEMGEKFKEITLVDAAVEALKITNAPLPMNDLKDLLEYSLNYDLYVDILLILARKENYTILEKLKKAFIIDDFIRSREIIQKLWSIDPKEIQDLYPEIERSPDWVLEDFLHLDKMLTELNKSKKYSK